MHAVRDLRHRVHQFRTAALGDGDRQPGGTVRGLRHAVLLNRRKCLLRRRLHARRVSCQFGQLLLHGLKFGNRTAELLPLPTIGDGAFHKTLRRARHLRRAKQRSGQPRQRGGTAFFTGGAKRRPNHDLGQVPRGGVAPACLGNHKRVRPSAAIASLFLRNHYRVQTHLARQRHEPLAAVAMRFVKHVGRKVLGEHALHCFHQQRVGAHHRSPSPRAMIPRKISPLPPRRENDGARSVVRCSAC